MKLTVDDIKRLSHRLTAELTKMNFEHNKELSHSSALNLISKLFNYDNYNQAKAMIDTFDINFMHQVPGLQEAQVALFKVGKSQNEKQYKILFEHRDYLIEFYAIIGRTILFQDKTVYLCAPILEYDIAYDPDKKLMPSTDKLDAIIKTVFEENPGLIEGLREMGTSKKKTQQK
jgi:hypothetical protein